MIGRLIRRIAHRVLRGFIRARLLVVVLLGLLLVAGAAGLMQSASLPGISLGLPGTRRAPDATESFMKAQQSYNAELMWGSYGDEALERLRLRGASVESMQREMERARTAGVKFERFDYVGGYNLPDGTSLQFYVVASRGPTTRSELEHVTYIFTLDRLGKISKVQ